MAKQFPRAGKPKAGGTKVTSCRSFSRRTSALTNAAPINSLERLKKSGVDFYTSSFGKLRALVVGQNGFSRQKNKFFGGGNTRPVVNRRGTDKNRRTVTTTHLFWPGQRRNAVFLLPFSQPNCDFLGSNCNETAPPGGVVRGIPLESALSDHLRRKFYSKWPT